MNWTPLENKVVINTVPLFKYKAELEHLSELENFNDKQKKVNIYNGLFCLRIFEQE